MNELARQLLEELFSQDYDFTDEKGEKFSVSPAGNLSLMTYGYKATIALRKARGWKFENGKLIIPQDFFNTKASAHDKD